VRSHRRRENGRITQEKGEQENHTREREKGERTGLLEITMGRKEESAF
jgi:hypothetical protein